MAKAIKVKAQLKAMLAGLGVKIRKSDDYDDPEAILKSLITGYFANVAQRQADGSYRNVRSDDVLTIHPSSVLANIKPKWVLYHEIMVTSKRYMREVSAIQVEWLFELAPHFYIDRRKAKLEERHKKESIRNVDHDFKGAAKPKEDGNSISSMIAKSNSRFSRKGINLGLIENAPQPLAIKDDSLDKSDDRIDTAEPVVFKRFKKSSVPQDALAEPKLQTKQQQIGLSFDDEY